MTTDSSLAPAVCDPACGPEVARDFLEALFADAVGPQARLVIFTAPGEEHRRFEDIDDAARYAASRAGAVNVYFGVGLIGGAPPGRGKAADVAALPGLWADVDLAGPAHPGKALPATAEEAQEALARLPLPPTLLVHTGHGLHAYWLFKEPWAFAGAADRARAARLAKGWHGLACARAAERGWHLENLGDRTRVLRPPGTTNHKVPGRPAPVTVLVADLGRRYDPGDFEPFLPDEPATGASAIGELAPGASGPPADKLALALAECPLFLRTWQRRRDDLPDQSQSGYDLSLATVAALRGWADPEIAALIFAHRAEHGQRPEKALREDYMRRTVERARAAAEARAPAPEVDLSALLARVAPRPAAPAGPAAPGPLPAGLLDVPGFNRVAAQ